MRFSFLCSFCFLVAACGGAGQGGLSNVPAPARIDIESLEGHDVISNGPESCPRADGPDPLPNRAGRCPERPSSPQDPGR